MKYWQPKYETMPQSDIEALQLKRLKNAVKNVYKHVPFYRQAFSSAGIKPDDIRSLGDISRLPTTSKAELLNNTLWDERDLTNSSSERVIFPETCVLTDHILKLGGYYCKYTVLS